VAKEGKVMKRLFSALLAGGLLFGMIANAGAKPLTAWEDPSGDAGVASQSVAVPGSEMSGFDLVSGTIEKKGANLEFTVTQAGMPPSGELPEGFRFLWHINVAGKEYRFSAKSVDIGKPDPLSGPNGQERLGQVYLDGQFRLETWEEQPPVGVLSTPKYQTIAYLDGTFDPAAASFTIILPLKTIKAKAGQTIAGGTGAAAATQCVICWVPQYAERSLTPHTVIDYAIQTTAYKIPK
jgi:hypothetical protein